MEKGKSYTLAIGMQIGISTMRNSVEFPKNIKIELFQPLRGV
jgi:hypothetical protein